MEKQGGEIAVAMRSRIRSRKISQLLVPLVMAALAFAAVIAWLKGVEAASNRQHAALTVADAATATPDPTLAPRPYTAPFMSGIVPTAGGKNNIYLYVSPSTSRYLASVGASYDALLLPWRSYFHGSTFSYTEIDRLDVIPQTGSPVLILPSSVSLSEAERRQLLAFQRGGGSILATWATGARGGTGKWEGYEFAQQLFGVRVEGELDPASDERFLNLHGDSPVTAGYPAGRRLWLENTAEQALRLSGGRPAAVYMNWLRDAGSRAASAVLFDEQGAERHYARWVLFGFSESSWGSQAAELKGMLDNALHWLVRGVGVTKATWPMPYRAAYVFEMDTEDGFGNAHRFATLMDNAGLRATFYCLTSEALRYPYLVRRLSKQHEIAYHGDIHTGFSGQPKEAQSRRLDQMQAEMQSIINNRFSTVGFRAPLEQYDRMTERLLHAKGFMHHAADPNRTDARLPFFSPESDATPDKALVVLPRTQQDDIGLHAGKKFEGAGQKLLHALIHDFDNIADAGGMGLLSVHSQYFGKGSLLLEMMPTFLDTAKKRVQDVWIVPANDIAQWWRERERMRYVVSGTSDSFNIDVTVEGNAPLKTGAVIVTHRRADASVVVQPVEGYALTPKVRRLDRFRSAIVFDDLAVGSHAYRVRQVHLSDNQTPGGAKTENGLRLQLSTNVKKLN